jgi:hypothetical protein
MALVKVSRLSETPDHEDSIKDFIAYGSVYKTVLDAVKDENWEDLIMAFNLEDYEDVATLNKWLISNYPMFRSDLSVISHDPEKGFILMQATIWRDSKDAAPAVSNVAFGSRETYIQNMKKFYVEDTATSALGRAIILLKGSDKTATKDDMRKVETINHLRRS